MTRNLVARFTILMLVGTACQSREGTATDDAASKIAQAREKAGELANSAQNYQPVRFVSDIERIDRPVTKPKPAEVVRPGTDSVEVEPVVMPTEVPEIAPPEIAVDSSTVVVSVPSVPSIIPRDAPQPEAVGGGTGSGTTRGNDPGPDIGTIIGVVIRGGVGVDHCAKHPRGGPTAIPNRIPSRLPSRIPNRIPSRIPNQIPNQFPYQLPNR